MICVYPRRNKLVAPTRVIELSTAGVGSFSQKSTYTYHFITHVINFCFPDQLIDLSTNQLVTVILSFMRLSTAPSSNPGAFIHNIRNISDLDFEVPATYYVRNKINIYYSSAHDTVFSTKKNK